MLRGGREGSEWRREKREGGERVEEGGRERRKNSGRREEQRRGGGEGASGGGSLLYSLISIHPTQLLPLLPTPLTSLLRLHASQLDLGRPTQRRYLLLHRRQV